MLWWTLRKLRSTNRDVRRQAVEKLGKVKNARSVEWLVVALMDEDLQVRLKVEQVLNKIDPNWTKLERCGNVIPMLLTELNDNKSSVRSRAAAALGKIGDARAVEPLIKALVNNPSWVRWDVAIALGKIGDERAVEPLINALKKDTASNVRKCIVQALGKIKSKRIVEPLVAALMDKDDDVAKAAKEILEKIVPQWPKSEIGKNAVPAFVAILNDKSRSVQSQRLAAEALGEIGDLLALESLVLASENEDGNLRHQVKVALQKIHPNWMNSEIGRSIVPALVVALKHEDMYIRLAAVKTLREIGDSRAIEPLVMMLKDVYQDVRKETAKALKAFGWQPIDDTQSAVFAIADENWEKLVTLGKAAVDPLLAALDYKNINIQMAAANALGKIGDAFAVMPLVEAFESSFPPVEEALMKALVKIGNAAVEPIMKMLRNYQSHLQSSAIYALASVGSAAVEILLTGLSDEDNHARSAAARALGKIGDLRAVEPLIISLNDMYVNVREAVAEALGEIGDIKSTNPLEAVFENENEIGRVRKAAADALIKIWNKALEYGQADKVRNLVVEKFGKQEPSRYNPVYWGFNFSRQRYGCPQID